MENNNLLFFKILKIDSHCRQFHTISRQRFLSTQVRDTSNLGDCPRQTDGPERKLHRFVFITKRECPPTLTHLLSLFPGCNCYLVRSQGIQQIIDELEKVQGDRDTVSHVTNMVQHSVISCDGGVTGLVSQRHLVERFCDGEGADQVHPRRLDLRADVPLVNHGGLFVKEFAIKRDESSRRFPCITTAWPPTQSTRDTTRGRLCPAPNRGDRETCQNQFSINNNKLPGTSRRRHSHRFDHGLISPQDKWAGSQHKDCRLLADKPVAVGLTDAGCGVFANTSARIQPSHQEAQKMSYLLEASCSCQSIQ